MQMTDHAQDTVPNETNYTDSSNSKGSPPRNGKTRRNWLNELGVADGEWYMNPIARPERLMGIILTSEASRVYACLEVHTMRFSQEEAVIAIPDETRNGEVISWKFRYLTTTDIAEKCQMDQANVRRALRELEGYGLVKRKPAEGNDLHKGNIVILSWAKPRNPVSNGKEGERRSRATSFLGDEFSLLQSLIKRLKIQIPKELEGLSPEQMLNLSRDRFLEAQEVARRIKLLEKEVEDLTERGLREMAHHYSVFRVYSDVCQSEEPTPEDGQTDQPPKPEPEPTPPPPSDPAPDAADAELDALITGTAQKIRGEGKAVEEPGPNLPSLIKQKLTGAPIYRLRQRAQERMRRGDSLGKLIYIAEDVGNRWRAEQREVERAEQAKEQQKIEAWKEIINNPDEEEDLREQCREQLRARGIVLTE